MRIDFSRQLVDRRSLALLFELAAACQLEQALTALFSGAPVNTSEGRPAWHTALRTEVDDPAVARMVSDQRRRMYELADGLRAEHAAGRVHDVFVLGIGGSDLGPRLVSTALGRGTGPHTHFVSNLDPWELDEAMRRTRPDTTAVIAVSKSFSTLETLENLRAARAWLGSRAPERIYAVTAFPERACREGVREEHVLAMPAWVGGRFSVWSSCGVPVAISHGTPAFDALLAGAQVADEHFRTTPLEQNVPVLLAMLDIWNSQFLGLSSRAVFPYSQRLELFPQFLQQLEMESCGKRVDAAGRPLMYPTGRVVWGGAGTTAQHSVFQFLHQGTDTVPSEFIVLAAHRTSSERRERLLFDFALAQADALAFGDFALPEKSRPSKHFAQCPGDRPSVVVTLDDLSPSSLGALLAVNEHRTFSKAIALDINAFDQWGVEIGKQLLASRSAD
jgi:glucose-6-phosphate isomerase